MIRMCALPGAVASREAPKGSVGIVPPEDGFGWSGRHPGGGGSGLVAPIHGPQRARAPRGFVIADEPPEAGMFEPLDKDNTERSASNRKTMTIIWAIVGVSVVVLVLVSFM